VQEEGNVGREKSKWRKAFKEEKDVLKWDCALGYAGFERHKAAAAYPCISASAGRGLSGTRLLQPVLVYQLRQEEV